MLTDYSASLPKSVEETVESVDPLRIRVTAPCDGDELHLTLDEEMNVVDATVRE